jgi:hypothetical protein
MENLNNTNKNSDNSEKELRISDVIHSNMVDGQLDAVGALTQIFNEECAKAVMEDVENRQELLEFITWLNNEKKLGYTSVGLERIVDNYIRG